MSVATVPNAPNGEWRAMAELFGRTLMLPFGLFVASLEVMLQTVRRIEDLAGRVSGSVGRSPAPDPKTFGVQRDAFTPEKREVKMNDMSLSDDMVKLVRFTIVNIERDKEGIVFPKGEELVTDSMTDDAFAAWMISKHVKWADPKGAGDEDPRKYLRVSYEVIGRWPKQDRKYEKRQLDVLREIRDAIREGS